MEPPSPTLSTALRDLKLASRHDLRRAARHCRRLSRDLPAFDSVWIDALVRLRKLTLYQATELQDGRADRLRIGDFVLRDRLGNGPGSVTATANQWGDGSQWVLKILTLPPERRPDVEASLNSLIQTVGNRLPSTIVAPHRTETNCESLVLISRTVAGLSARQHLIRRGRFAPADVVEIAWRLLGGLDELHCIGCVHGDIQAGNLIGSARHGAVLVDAGVRPAINPVLPLDETRSPVWYEGTAPERIGTGAAATPASDLFALGCLLWHLLAGRPPFPAGDALTMLTAHRNRSLPPITDFAPSTPTALAELITETTRTDPEKRPTDLAEWQRRLRSSRPKIVRRSDRPGSNRSSDAHRFPWRSATAATVALGLAAYTLSDHETAKTLLSIGSAIGTPPHAAATELNVNDVRQKLLPLPEPDSSGIITLEHPGPYAVGDVVHRGPLRLCGQADRLATIVVTDRPLHLFAEECTLEHLHVIFDPPSTTVGSPSALALVETQALTIRNCRFDGLSTREMERRSAPAGVAWRLVDRQDATAGRIRLEDSSARGVREPLFLADAPREVSIRNVLAVGVRSLLAFQKSRANRASVTIENTTLRDADTVFAFGEKAADGRLHIDARDSVLDLPDKGTLFQGLAKSSSTDMQWGGSGVVTTGDLQVATRMAEGGSGLSADLLNVTGVSQATVAFAGPADGSDAASVATVRGVPRQSGQLLGVDLSRLPRPSPVSDQSR